MGALSGYAIGCCLIIILIASAVLIGWFGDIRVLTRIMPTYAAMVPATAASLILLAVCVLDQLRGGKSRFRVRLTLVAALCLLVYDLVHSLHWWLDAQEALDAARDNGMSVATQFCLFLAVLCLWPRARPVRQGYPWVTILATVGLIAALVALVGYLLDASALYSVFVFSDMALHTAISYALLFSAILLARRLFPWALLFPLSVSYVALVSTQTGLIDENMRLSLLAIMLSLISSAAIMRAAALENAAERAEVAQEARLQNLLDGIGANIFAIGPDGQVQFANRQAQELTRKAGSPQRWLKAGSPQRWLTETPFVGGAGMTPLPAEEYPLARLLREEEPEAMRLAYPDEKGELVHLRALRGEYTDLQGERIQTLALRDVTEDTRIRAKLARSAQLDSLGRLSGGIAHDIANLLGIIRLSADVGQLSDDPAAMRAQFESVQRACVRGAELTDRILAFAQRQPGQDETINLSALVRDVFGFVGRMISSDLDFRVDVPMEDVHVTCDPGQLENALINLVLNARDALSTGHADVGRIVLGVVMEQDRPVVFVSDNGPGMSDYIRQRATDPFYTTRQDDGGTGLGLSIVEAFSLHVGADMQIDSAPGKGTRVALKFPATSRTTLTLAEGAVAEKVEGLSGLRILVVEDDAAFRQSVTQFLTGQGAKVVSVGTGGAAMDVLAESDLDVLLTDITMAGGVDGFAVARAAVVRRPDFPIVYLSGYANPEIADVDRPRGTFLKKPVSGADLSRAIRAAV